MAENSQRDVEVDAFIVSILTGDRLLLCSDGLWEMVRDADIQRIISDNKDPSQVVKLLIQAALAGGGNDNVSIISLTIYVRRSNIMSCLRRQSFHAYSCGRGRSTFGP